MLWVEGNFVSIYSLNVARGAYYMLVAFLSEKVGFGSCDPKELCTYGPPAECGVRSAEDMEGVVCLRPPTLIR